MVKKYIERIQEVNPDINAVVHDRFADALKEAQKIDELITEADPRVNEMPLLGVPFSVRFLNVNYSNELRIRCEH